MTDKEKMFYENQKKNPPIGMSESFVDHNQSRQKRRECSRNESYDDKSFDWASEKKSRWLLVMI